METNPDSGIPLPLLIIIVIAIVLVSGYFNMVRSAFKSINRSKFKDDADSGDERAAEVLAFTENMSRVNSGTRVWSIFLDAAAMALSVFGIVPPLKEVLSGTGSPADIILSGIIVVIGIAFVILSLGLILPEKTGHQNAESIARKNFPFIKFMLAVARPFSWFSEKTANLFLHLSRQDTDADEEEFSEEEVMSMLESGQESGALKEEGKKMIDSIFAFDDKLAYEIMTPRTDVFAIDLNDPPSEYMDELLELKYSRVPVYKDDSDNIIGILNIKDFFKASIEEKRLEVDISKILREPYLVPETKNIDSLFFELQKKRQHIAILIDEYGGFAGIVTLEDIIEEVMGEIDDEYDEAEEEITKIDDDTYVVSGFMDLDDLNEEIGSDFESETSETIGGFVLDMLGQIPDEDDPQKHELSFGGYDFTIESVKDRRIEKVRIHREPEEEERE
ncbi:MAG: HlyC/CorC family transporter [Firmicutes bacterium]|nr:HlyC/CorC family transporter [Bacillota bacterium]